MHKYLSSQTIEAVMLEVAHMPPDDVGYLTDQMREEQPVILDYLYRLDDLPIVFEEEITFTEAEMEYILYIGIIIWKALKQAPRPLRLVTWEMLDTAVDETEKYFARLIRRSPMDVREEAMQTAKTHPEPELLCFIIIALQPRENDPDFPPIRPEYRHTALVIFQVILKALLDSEGGKKPASPMFN